MLDIPVWDGNWEQATSGHFCPFRKAAHSKYPLSPHQVMVGTLESRIHRIHLYLSQQIGVRSSKTSQCGSANRPSVVPQGSPRFWCLSKSLLVSWIAVSVCRHDLPPCTARWPTLLGVTIRWLEASPWSLYFPHWLGHCTQGPTWPLHAW